MPQRISFRLHRVVDTPTGLFYDVTSAHFPHRSLLLPTGLFPIDMLLGIEVSPGPQECTMFIYATANPEATHSTNLDIHGPFELHRVRFHPPVVASNGRVTDLGVEQLDETHYDALF